jgi:hypothetical protein
MHLAVVSMDHGLFKGAIGSSEKTSPTTKFRAETPRVVPPETNSCKFCAWRFGASDHDAGFSEVARRRGGVR